MAITLSSALNKGYLGAGDTPRVKRYLVSGTAAESGDIEIEHGEGRPADKVTFTQLTGAAQLYIWKRSADDEDNTTITLGTVPALGTTGYADLHFYGNDSPDVTE